MRCRLQGWSLRGWSRCLALSVVLAIGSFAHAATVTWTGGGGNDNWDNSVNWGGATPVVGDDLVFAGNSGLTPNNNFAAGTTFASITFSAGAGNFVIGGNAFTLSGGATALTSNAISGTMTITNAVTFSTAAPTITMVAGGTLVLSGAIDNGGLLLTVTNAGPATLGGAVVGAGGLTKTGAGILTLSGLSSTAGSNYAGTTTINGGTLAITTTDPTLSGALICGLTAGSTTVSALDLSAASLTCGAFTVRTNSASANTVTIGATRTFTTGSVVVGTAVSAANTVLNVSGAGSWVVNAPAGSFWLGGYFPVVGNNSNQATLDLSGLATFTCDLTTGSMLLGRLGDNSIRSATMTLATDSTIRAATLTVGESASASPVNLRLGGGTNLIHVDTLNIGTGGRDSGLITFAGGTGTLQVRNRAGTGRANINVETNASFVTGYEATNTINLAGHAADLLINNLVVGGQPRTSVVTNTITFDTGTLDVTTVRLGLRSGTTANANAHTSTLNLGGGTVIIGAGGLEMATNSATGGTANALNATVNISGGTVTIANNATLAAAIRLANNGAASGGTTANGVLNLTGGSLTVAGNVILGATTRPATATMTLNGATFDVGGRIIGSATATVTSSFQAGSLTSLAELNGGGAFTKSTAGTLTLGGVNGWSGATSISAGTMVLAATNALPSGTGKGNVTVTGTLDLAGFSTSTNGLAGAGTVTSSLAGACVATLGNNNASTTFSGVIQDGAGTVAVTKTGTGTLILSGANTYTGATDIGAGILRVTGSLAVASAVNVSGTLEAAGTIGSLALASGGTVAPGSGGTTVATLSTGAVTSDAASVYLVDLDGVTPTADLISTASSVALAGSLTVMSNSNPGGGKVYTIVSAGSLTGTFAGLSDGATFSGGGRAFRINYTPTTATLTDISSVWDGGSLVDDLWSRPENWEGDSVPLAGSHLVFAGNTRLTPVNDLAAGTTFASLSFSPDADSFSISGNSLTISGGSGAMANAAVAGTMTITAPLTFSAAPTLQSTSTGTLALAGPIDNNGLTVTVAGSGPLTISGVLSGSGGLTKTGTGTLTLSGQGTWTGGTVLSSGNLVVAASGGAISGPLSTGTLTIDSAPQAARVLLSGGQTVSNALVMTSAAPGVGLGALQQTGSGVAEWSGSVTINADSINGGHLAGGASAADALRLSGVVSMGGSATRVVQRAGFVIYAGTPGTLPELALVGTAQLGAAGALPANVRVVFSASAVSGETGFFDLNGFDQTVSGLTFQLAAGGVVTTGVGTLTLGGDITTSFTGTLDAGVNTIAGNLDLGGATRTVTVANSSAANDLTISAVITNGALTKAGSGTLAFTGTAANTYTGITTVSAGGLHLNKTAGIDAVAGDLAIAGGWVTFGANHQIADTATVTMSGTTSVFNGTAANAGTLADFTETIAALTVTGGAFNCGATASAPNITVTGATSFTGGGNTIFIGQSGTTFTTGSLSLSAMSATAGGTVATNNSFTLYGAHTTVQSRLSVGAGGITLNNSALNLRRGGVGSQGSRLVLDGDVTASGSVNCSITEDTNGGTNGAIALELSSTAPAVTRSITSSLTGATALTIGIPVTNGASAAAAITKAGTGQVTFSGGLANTYTGITTVTAGVLRLVKTAAITAIAGDLVITGGQVSFGASNQIADSCNVTMSGITSVFNGIAGVNQGAAIITETIGSLVATGGNFNAGIASVWTITGTLSMTGGGNTIFVGNNGNRLTVGSLSLTAMTATAGNTVPTNDSFTMYGTNATQVSILTVGSGGLTLDGSVLNLRRGNVTGNRGSKLVLNGDITTTGTVASSIKEDTAGGTIGTIGVELSGSVGAFTRTITTGAGGADLTISIPIVDGSATPGSVIKSGTSSLTTTATNTWSGTTTVAQGALYLMGTQATTAVTVDAGATLGGSGTIAGTLALNGELAPGSGGTTTGQLSTGATTRSATSVMTVDLNGTGLVADLLTTAGQVQALDGTLTVSSLINETPGQVFTILSASTITNTFTNASSEGSIVPVGAGGKAVSISYATPGVVTCTVLQPPTVASITPDNGPTTAQTSVIITGNFFDPTATVTIGGNPATSVVWNSATSISAVTPTGTQGLADVVVINPGTNSGTLIDGYAYTGVAPTVTSLTPAFGPAMSTTDVIIRGTDFWPGTSVAVSVGGIAATAVSYVDSTTINATVPAMNVASADATPDVVVTIGDRQQATLANGFTYTMRTPENPSSTIAGLAYRYHRVGGAVLPTFSTMVPFYQGITPTPSLSQSGVNPFEGRATNWSAELGGYVTVPDDGIYRFFTLSDDVSRLYIGTTLVVDNNLPPVSTERSGLIALTAGTHQLRVEYAQDTNLWDMTVSWQGPGPTTVTKQVIPNSAFTCDPTTTITSITPASGPQGGGTDLTIAGNNFVPGSTVVIGGTLGILPVVLNANTITVTTPGGTLGAQDVLVMGPRSAGTTRVGGFTYVTSAPPTLTAINPPNGTAFGGTTVTLTVSNVNVVPTVTFNGVAATSVVRLDSNTVTCVTPAMPLSDATADVVVTAGGQSATLVNGYTWDGLRTPENPTGTQAGLAYNYYHSGGPTLPTFSALTPFSTGITGTTVPSPAFGWTANPIEPAYTTNFSLRYLGYLMVPADGIYTLFTASDDGSRLYVGGTLVVDNNFSQAVTERSGMIALSAGTHLMTVEYAQGTGGFGMYVRWQGPNLAKADIPDSAFTTDPTPAFSTSSPLDVVSGPQSGGTAVTITGSGFTSAATVTFGGTTAIGITVVNSTTITCTTPSHATGLVAVTVTNPTGTSATLANAFTYIASAGPAITSLDVTSGPAGGGTAVIITGSGFGAPITVTFGGQAATNVQVTSSTTISLLTPPMVSATLAVDVVVTNGAAQSATLVGGFTYILRVPENPTNVQAGLTYRYHRVGGPLLPTFTSLTPYSIGVRSNATVTPGTNPLDAGYLTNWSVEYRGYITVPADGIYTFFTESDDGSQLLIGTGVVVANNFAQAMTERSGSIGLATGTHLMSIRFAQGTGGFGLNVRWQGPAIAKQLIPDNVLWTDATPTFTGINPINPNAGTSSGGTAITITGTGFTSGTTVTIGGTAATSVVVASDGLSLTAVTPAHAIGSVPVVVTNGNGLSVTQANGYLYQGPTPTVTAVSPLGGPIAGGTIVYIYGTNFAAGVTVTIGGVSATNVSLSGGVITATTPAGARGPAVVTVTNTDTQSASRSPGFYYQGPTPTITSLSVTNGPMAGGTAVTVIGTGFDASATLTFDGVAATGVTVVNSTTITLFTPANPQGPADLVLTNTIDMGSVTRASAFIFEGPAPTATGITPSNGTMTGGTSVTISGNNFAAGATVTFDGVAATGVTVNGPGTAITATTPAGTQGPVDVVVTNVDLLAATLTNGYTYLGTPPVIGGVSPLALPTNDQTTPITISGSGFVVGVQVTIGGVTAPITSVSSGAIVVTMPAGIPPGPAPIVVTNVDTQTVTFNGFVVQGPAPILTGIDVPFGPVEGGRRMTLTGSAFRAGATVTVGGIAATNVQVLSSTTITALTPAHPAGAATVTVTNDDLLSSSLVSAYRYYTKTDNSVAGNGCGTGGGLAVFLFLAFLSIGGAVGRRR